jgi:hypothetical protein
MVTATVHNEMPRSLFQTQMSDPARQDAWLASTEASYHTYKCRGSESLDGVE